MNTIEFESTRGVARIALNRPSKLNAFNTEMHDELRRALRDVAADPESRVVLLTGNGRAFCAGQDLADRDFDSGDKPDIGESLEKYYNPLIRTITRFPLPVVCAVNGVAAGAGANLALACDIVIAARSASFIQAFCRIGLIPDAGGTWILPRLVGRARATALSMLGDQLDAETAKQWGLIWEVVDDEDLPTASGRLVERLAASAPRGLTMTKQALLQSAENSLDQQLDLERDLQRNCGLSDDYREGVEAFKEKRQPQFKGR